MASDTKPGDVGHLALYLRAYTGGFVRIAHIAIGREAANAYMLANEGQGLIATSGHPDEGGLCFIADCNDMGTHPSKL